MLASKINIIFLKILLIIFVRRSCDCCDVCLKNEFELCDFEQSHRHRICDQELLCYRSNQTLKIGFCVKACRKLQCLMVNKSNRTYCECAHRNVPCDSRFESQDDVHCYERENRLRSAAIALPRQEKIDCSKIICKGNANKTSVCPSDSEWIVDNNISSVCCQSSEFCSCLSCPKTICNENSILQIYRTGDGLTPGLCCDQYHCTTNAKHCYHDKKIYRENEKWSIDQCTECVCQDGHVDCTTIQCPSYTHCGYMYKPENECCPVCGGCLSERFHVQHMNSTWVESNGCMKCWCEDGRSRCVVEGCIAPPCENPRQIANVCCPVCMTEERTIDSATSNQIENACPNLDHCRLSCSNGYLRDQNGCSLCNCSIPIQFQIDQCPTLICDKHCPYSFSIDDHTGCPLCQCNPCPPLHCLKNCTYGLKKNEIGCPLCICESQLNTNSHLQLGNWPRHCQSGLLSYSNGEIWFDGCRQCLCYKGQTYCTLISCPVLKCTQPIFLTNRCCPTCPDNTTLLAEPTPSSQVCYASQSVSGEELEFDRCTKCICLEKTAFCSISLCPPLSCSSPIYDPSLCCPICPTTATMASDDKDFDETVCLLENGSSKNAGEVWKQNECQSCLCPRSGHGQIRCFYETCPIKLPCSNPVLKKGQCCPFCLPSTAVVSVCIFNYVQYRSGEHWNVSDCHHCQCLQGTIVCHQRQCPSLTCIHTETLPGHCCPTCRKRLNSFSPSQTILISARNFGFSIIVFFTVFIIILLLIILSLLIYLVRGRQRTMISSSSFDHYNLSVPSKSSIAGIHATIRHSLNHENEPIHWLDEDGSIIHSTTTSDPDDQEIIQIIQRPPTIIYV